MNKFIPAVLIAGLLGLVAFADEPAKPKAKTTKEATVHRLAWEEAEKECQFVDKGNDTWYELGKDGKPVFEFKESRRNCDFVELNDKRRGLTLRLYKDAMFMKGGPVEDFTKYYDGKWVK